MGGGASTAVAGMPQGVEIRKERSTGLSPFGKMDDASEHYKFAVVQCSMLKDSLHDATTTISCLRAINEAMNEAVESKDAQHMREELCGCGLDDTVVKLMRAHSGHSDLQRECLVTIGSLAYKSESRKARLVKLGAGDAVVSALANHADLSKVQEEGLWSAGNLSAGSEALKARFFETRISAAILHSLSSNCSNANVQKTGLICIGNLSNGSDARCDTFMGQGAALACVAALTTHAHNADVQSYGLFAAGNLAEFSGSRGVDLMAAGIVSCLAAAFRDHPEARVVQQYACKLACVLVRGGKPPANASSSTLFAAASAAKKKKNPSRGSGGNGGVNVSGDGSAGGSRGMSPWEGPFMKHGIPGLIRKAKTLHSADKAGVVRWADAAEREMQREDPAYSMNLLEMSTGFTGSEVENVLTSDDTTKNSSFNSSDLSGSGTSAAMKEAAFGIVVSTTEGQRNSWH